MSSHTTRALLKTRWHNSAAIKRKFGDRSDMATWLFLVKYLTPCMYKALHYTATRITWHYTYFYRAHRRQQRNSIRLLSKQTSTCFRKKNKRTEIKGKKRCGIRSGIVCCGQSVQLRFAVFYLTNKDTNNKGQRKTPPRKWARHVIIQV